MPDDAVDLTPRLLNVYSPQFWHDEAGIVGNRAALEQLKRAIDEALKDGASGFGAYTAGDGEGFGALVLLLPDDEDHYDFVPSIKLPYADEIAADHHADRPWWSSLPQAKLARRKESALSKREDATEEGAA